MMVLNRNKCLWCNFALLLTITTLILLAWEFNLPTYLFSKNLYELPLPLAYTNHSNKLILIYTGWFRSQPWPFLKERDQLEHCQYTTCAITYDKRTISAADAVVFHGVDLKRDHTPYELRELSKREKRLTQKWIFHMQESPHNYKGFQIYDDVFDWVMSYKHTSDIFFPYGYHKPLDTRNVRSKAINYAENKTKLGIWIQSHCGLTRDRYMHALNEHIPITVAGKCARHFGQSNKCDRHSEACQALVRSHKFYFAFENSFCDHYISEKYWGWGIEEGLVPVVMGPRYVEPDVIPESYIDAFNYSSIEELATYLKYLDENDDEYNKYFRWKEKYKTFGYAGSIRSASCQLCKRLHETNESNNRYKNIWPVSDCTPFQDKSDLLDELVNKAEKGKRGNSRFFIFACVVLLALIFLVFYFRHTPRNCIKGVLLL